MVECRINNTRLHAFSDFCTQYSFTRATLNTNPITIVNAAIFSIMRMNFNNVFTMPSHIFSAACLCTHVILRQNTPCRQNQWIFCIHFFSSRYILCNKELTFTTHKLINVHNRCTFWIFIITRPLNTTHFV